MDWLAECLKYKGYVPKFSEYEEKEKNNEKAEGNLAA